MMAQIIISMLILLPGLVLQDESFREKQMRYPRVSAAYNEKFDALRNGIDTLGIGDFDLFIRVLKVEELLEVWMKNKDTVRYQLFREYEICSSSGSPGPKRRQGDYQVPEGFYHINVFNPYSRFHLSLGINYPNRSDRILADPDYPGGDIYIHGSCVTIGCIPLTDEIIKELYVLVVEARNSGQDKIPVHIFPTRLQDSSLVTLYYLAEGDEGLYDFWMNLKEGFDFFETHKTLPDISVATSGVYIVR
jgi:murein L,D-transpeptidase YafK